MCFFGQPLRRALNHNREYKSVAYPAKAPSRRGDLHASYLAFRLVFRAGAAIRNVARSVQATSAESELQ